MSADNPKGFTASETVVVVARMFGRRKRWTVVQGGVQRGTYLYRSTAEEYADVLRRKAESAAAPTAPKEAGE